MLIQIYEIQTPAEAEAMIALGVDHLGSVLLSKASWQDTVLRQAMDTTRNAGRKSCLIPLFHDVAAVSRAIDYYRPDIIHFCEMLPWTAGNDQAVSEALARQGMIRERFPGVAIMRSIPIGEQGGGGTPASLRLAERFEPLSDWFLTDTVLSAERVDNVAAQPESGFVGITGRTCDWTVARELVARSRIPVILAGGIGPDNVQAGILRVQPAGVDSCTLTNATDARGNTVRFKKDPMKVEALIRAAREAAQQVTSIR